MCASRRARPGETRLLASGRAAPTVLTAGRNQHLPATIHLEGTTLVPSMPTQGPDHDRAAHPRPRGARLATWLLALAGGAALVFMGRRVDWPVTAWYLRRLGLRAPLVLVPYFFGLLSDTLGWRSTFDQPSRLPLALLWRVRAACEAVTGSLPAGAAAGDSLRAWLLARHFGLGLGEASANVVFSRAMMVAAHAAFLVCGTALAGTPGRGRAPWAPGGLDLRIVAIVALAVCAAAAAGIFFLMRRSARDGARQGVGTALQRAFGPTARVSAWGLGKAFGFFFGGWLCLAAECWLILDLLGTPVSFATAVWVEAAASLVRIAFFLVPGAVGAQEVGYFALLKVAGVPNATVIAAAFMVAKRSREIFWIAIGYLALFWMPTRDQRRQ